MQKDVAGDENGTRLDCQRQIARIEPSVGAALGDRALAELEHASGGEVRVDGQAGVHAAGFELPAESAAGEVVADPPDDAGPRSGGSRPNGSVGG
jgi:hypothetical protein